MSASIPAEIPDDCIVYRPARLTNIKPDGTPQSDCFADLAAPDESAYYMSVYFADEMAEAGVTVRDLQEHRGSRWTILECSARELRAQGEALWRDPNDAFPGHGASKRADGSERSRGQKRQLAKVYKVAPGLS